VARTKSHGDAFSHSMTDLMAGVAVTFLLIAAIFMVQAATRAEAEAKASQAAREELNKRTSTDRRAIAEIVALRDALSASDGLKELVELVYDAERDPFLLTIVFDRGRLRFDAGDCALRDDTRAVLDSSFGEIFDRVCRTAASGFIQSITLEGHTDNRPFFPADRVCGVERAHGCGERRALTAECAALGFANNVRLSAARAQNVFFHMRDVLGTKPELTSCLDTKFVVAGRGPVEPSDGGDWRRERPGEEHERNRRVVIKVRATSRTEESGT
jgi:flagellar motor protein MotB